MVGKLFFILSCVFLANGTLFAQALSEVYTGYKGSEVVDVNQLNFRLENISFFRNNEYKGNIVDGYSLTGEMVRPKLGFAPTKSLYLELGAHFLKYHGRNELSQVLPWFSARYNFSDRFQVVFGNLNQNRQHNLSEHLWEPERIYTDRPEEGLQFLYSGEKLDIQTWLSWEQFILKDDPFQEYFTVGISGNIDLFSNDEIDVTLPVQTLFYHRGGEIDQSPLSVQTHANVATGWNMAFLVNGTTFQSVHLNGMWYGYKSVSNSNIYPYDKGHAYSLDIQMKGKNGNVSLAYWNAFQFIAPKGREIYQSFSNTDILLSEPDRSILSAKYFWQKEIIKDAKIAFQVDAYFDLINSDFSYCYGIYLLFNGDFFLHQF